MSETRKNVVILGAGSVGLAVARDLVKKLDITRFKLIVISPRPVFVHLPGLIRTAVTSEGNLEREVLMPYANSLQGKGEVKVGTVVSFTETKPGVEGEVVLQDGERIPYAVLVLTPGSLWEGPLAIPVSVDDIQQHFQTWRAKIEKSKSIVLVGGGAVGIEFAGELKDFYPTKEVTLVHSKGSLLNDVYPDKYRSRLTERLRKTGTQLVFNDYVDATEPTEDGTIVTRNGKTVQADLVLQTRGARPNTQIVAAALGADSLTASGHVKVSPTLQLPGHANILAGGDVIDWVEQKQATKAAGHAAIIAKNVLNILNGTAASAVYKGSYEIIITTIGRTAGGTYFGVLWGLVFGDWVSSLIKSKGLIIEMVRGNYGLGRL